MNNPFKGTMAMKLHTLDEMTDRYIGPVGTPERDEHERMLDDELRAYHVGEVIRRAREAQENESANEHKCKNNIFELICVHLLTHS